MNEKDIKTISGDTEQENSDFPETTDRPNIIRQFLWAFIKPKQLYDSIKIKPMLFVPVLITLISGLFIGLKSSSYSLDPSMLSQLSPQQADQVTQLMSSSAYTVISVFSQLTSSVFEIFISAVVIYVLIKIFKGKGTFSQTLSLTGFAFAPFMIHSILRFIFSSPADMSQMLNKTMTFFDAIQSFMLSTGIVFIVWVIILMTIGFNRIFKMSKKRAILSAVTFYVLNIIFTATVSMISVNSISAMSL